MHQPPQSASAPRHPRRGRRRLVIVGVGAVTALSLAMGCGSGDDDGAGPTSTSTSSTEREGPTGTSTASTRPTEDETDGATLFADQCAGCHGTAGEGNLGPSLVGIADQMTREDQLTLVAEGRGTMLAFSGKLTDEQIAAVVDYTRENLG